jgi:hypothetical protein
MQGTGLLVQLVGHRRLGTGAEQAIQVERATGLGTGAGQPFAAEGLHPDHGAHDVAVDVEVADRAAFTTWAMVSSMRVCTPRVRP